MTWNHRIVKFKSSSPDELDYFAICEVYYNTQGKPNAHTAEGVRVGGESIEELKLTLERMLACLELPIIDSMETDICIEVEK
jgi:hypothetical protein